MSRIRIDEGELLFRFESHDDDVTAYIDRETGEILLRFEDDIDQEEEQAEIEERIESDPDRYVVIEPIESRDAFRIMERFVAGLPEGENRRLLEKALSWRKPFSNFKRALYDMGPLRESWFELHGRELRRAALEWLESTGIDAELAGPGPA